MSLVIVTASAGSAFAASYTMSITKYPQERTNWCWAACIKMIGVYYGKTYSQSSICTYVKGSTVNETATLSEVSSAIQYSTKKLVLQGGVGTLNAFVNEAKNSRPAVLRMGWNSGGGHVYVVRGAQEEIGAALASGTGKYTHTWWIY